MSTTGGTRKRKRVSKNKKKSWRKHTDIKDVEDFMEDQRMQERTGGIVADKPDEQLFVVEKRVDTADPSAPKKRKRGEAKPLKCHALLQSDPRTKPVRGTEHTKVYSVKKRHPAVREKIEKGVVPKGRQVALKQKKDERKQKRQGLRDRKKQWTAQHDLWDSGEKEETVDEHYLKVTKKMVVKTPNLYLKKPSGVSAIEVAHPGSSYNPSYEDHQDLLGKALVVEIEREKVEKKIQRSLDAKFPTNDKAPTVHSWLKEMGRGLFEDDESEEESADESDNEEEGSDSDDGLSNNPPVRRDDKKTLKQKRQDKERKDQGKLVLKAKSEKLRKNELFRLKSLKKEVKERQTKLASREKAKAELREANKDIPQKLGKLKFEAASLEIKLSDEIEGSLRLLKPEGHLLDDRFKSLQKRNMIEPRSRAKVVKKYKRKQFEKKSHKQVNV